MNTRTLSLIAALTLVGCTTEGVDGADGADGLDGMDGADGADGTDGQDGADGQDGVDGQNGADGVDGLDGLDGQDGVDGTDGQDGESVALMHLSLTGLVDLGPDFAYEGWIIVDGAPVSTGVFHVNADGHQSQSMFLGLASDVASATRFVLTIEPVPDPDPAPAPTHILAGDFSGDGADLTVDHEAAIGADFSTASGGFILATPSTASDGNDETQGIWWLDPALGPGASLDLPDLTGSGWQYEGWVVGPDGPISTGAFETVDGEDSDGAGDTAGPDGTPPFPGQDFITPARDLANGYSAVITIEPVPDNDPAPFGSLKPLVTDLIGPEAAPTVQGMDNRSAEFPAGTIVR